jgi:lipooligosaccharide transport system permease protein
MSTPTATPTGEARVPRQVGRILPAGIFGSRPWHVVERNTLAYRRMWLTFMTGFLEPVLFLGSIGLGVGKLVGKLPAGGATISYREFMAPGLLAITAMNGAIFDTTFNFFVKMKYLHVYDAMLATPLGPRDVARGEVLWALLRGAVYAAVFLLTMLAFGLVSSPWAIVAVPAAVLIGYAFAGAGLASATFVRSFYDFDKIIAVIMPLFLFSGTFFPLQQYPDVLQWIVKLTPLYQGVVLERAFVLGDVKWSLILNAAYLVALGAWGVRLAGKRMGRLLQT